MDIDIPESTTKDDNKLLFRDYSLDDSLYSRQRYVLGDFAMSKLTKEGDVFLCGLGGVGVEIAKNIILAGIKSLTLYDQTLTSDYDLSTQFYLDHSSIGKNRAQCSLDKLSNLNPYVKVKCAAEQQQHSLLDLLQSDQSFLLQFKCIILTETNLETQLKMNEFCRNNNIYFIVADVYGLNGWVFNDFGLDFKVYDKNGEDNKQVFISHISNEQQAIITTMDNHMHQFEDGDTVTFKEVFGMTEINNSTHKVTVLNPFSFKIPFDTTNYSKYERGGIVSQVKSIDILNFKPLNESIKSPDILLFDDTKNPYQIHLARETLYLFKENNGDQLPREHDENDFNKFISLAETINTKTKWVDEIDKELFKRISFTSKGKICPITSVIGAFAAQEVMKSLTGKFTPLLQWIYIDCNELISVDSKSDNSNTRGSTLNNNRLKSQLICLGKENCELLENSKIFMIGSGAIGCEMLKNYALLGIACGDLGKITITDNDLIEKSNLNRQFLYRNTDINQPKSKTARKAILEMNDKIKIEANQDKIDVKSENIYNSEFYNPLDAVVMALDNVEARMYVDQRCVTFKKALLESGTLGTKGHVQTIIPFLTESYNSQKDPNEKQTPFCTLKSFPSNLDHCIQWSRDKFEKLFSINPLELDQFLQDPEYLDKLVKSQSSNKISTTKSLAKLMDVYPLDYKQCVSLARIKFEKLFNYNVLHLIKAYPLDLMTKEGIPFWTSPKRPPTPIVFNSQDPTHMAFITSYTNLLCNIFSIPIENDSQAVINYCQSTIIPPIKHKNKTIISDEKAAAPVETFSMEEFEKLYKALSETRKQFLANHTTASISLNPQQFEKDDDSNHHISFITATANLRARIYSIEESDRFKVKLIAGKIIPAIATTTSVVSGLASLELLKVLLYMKKNTPSSTSRKLEDLDQFKNYYLNLSIPFFSQSNPGEALSTKVSSSFSFTLWDNWEINKPSMTVEEFIQHFEVNFKLNVTGIYHNVSMLFLSALPSHMKRRSLELKSLLHLEDDDTSSFVDLFVSFQEENGDEVNSPTIRFYL
ncbi:hypothetical protein CYY_005828 [Polysphondylium violaceum]|uniref:E1 ubiquitin-activating enzyme n=1 Tax=Polysphondylium violaceum TaxID=133409 RepID=A0A8J4Q247_9MYCE|nr:hypothetical protein CYY_005828 [Polysphondylium violaceum]